MTPPEFWYNPHKPMGFLKALVLIPLSWLIYLGACLRSFLTFKRRLSIPVICVGNFTVGGAGKTPTTLHIAQTLKGMGYKPAILSRGYRGRLSGPIKVDPAIHTHQDVGDEPLMMAATFDVYISKKRSLGAKLAHKNGADVIIMDDGLQNPTLHQDLKLSVVDVKKGFGNRHLLPAGPLREPLSRGLKRIDSLVAIRPSQDDQTKIITDTPQLKAAVAINKMHWSEFRNKPVVAFAGLAHPDKFFAMLASENFDVRDTKSFADHHVFTESDEADLMRWAQEHDAHLVTTEKDFVRLSQNLKAQTKAIGITLEFDDTNKLKRILETVMKRKT